MESINGIIINGVIYEAVEIGFNGCDDCALSDSLFCELSKNCIADLIVEFSIPSAMLKDSQIKIQ